MSDQRRLRQLLRSRHTCICISTLEEDYALEVVRDVAMGLGRELWVWCAAGGLRDGLIAGSPPIGNTEGAAEALRTVTTRPGAAIYAMLDLAPHLQNAKALRCLREALRRIGDAEKSLILIDADGEPPPVVQGYATPFELSVPDIEETERLLRETLRHLNREHPIHIDIPRSALDVILRNLQGLSRRQIRQVVTDVVADDRRLDASDIGHTLAAKRRLVHRDGLLEYIEAPATLDEIGGLRQLKAWLRRRERALTEQAVAFGLEPPRGVLMLGVQGAGKSLCAKAIAAAWRRPLLRMDVGALYDKYVGASEKRLRDALQLAERMSPNILWIDEIEKAFASAAAQSTDGGLSKRLFGSLLTWMQDHRAAVFLVATANDIEALPPELLRKGRFDEIFFVDLPTQDVRGEIFAIHLRKRGRDPALFDLEALSVASDGFSGAEIEQAVISALHSAFSGGRDVTTADLVAAIQESPPLSVTMAERIAQLRAWAQGRCVPAD